MDGRGKKGIVSVCWYNLSPLNSGGKVRTFNILSHMCYFQPWVIAPSVDIGTTGIRRVIIKGRFNKRRRYFNPEIFNYLWPDKRRTVARELKEINPDFVQAEGIWSFPAVYSFASRFKKHSIVVVHNIEHKVAEELYGRGFRSQFLKMMERCSYLRADIVVVCSEEDRLTIAGEFSIPLHKIIVVPNGVEEVELKETEKTSKEVHLLFMGKLNYGPNIEAVNFIKQLMGRLKRIKCMVIGEGLERKRAENIEYIGRVDDVREYLRKADICIAPLWAGSGTRLKVLEYLAMAKPVVATAKAVEGLGLRKDEDYLEAENIEEFEKAVSEILSNKKLWQDRAKRTRDFILERYSWDKIASNYEKELMKYV